MTIGGVEPVFVDTNILVYAAVTSAPRHGDALQAIRQLQAAARTELWVSRQILQEYLAVLSRPQTFAAPLAVGTLVADIRDFGARFRIAEDGPVVTEHLLTLLQQVPTTGRQIHDTNIVATMLAHGIRRLLTANTGDFARYAHLIAVEPLRPSA